jgi:SET domain-containing protein
MLKERLKKHIEENIYCRLGVSKISGVGVICIKPIPKGINPFKTFEKNKTKIIELNNNDLKNMTKNVKILINDFFGDDSTYDVIDPNSINISFYVNHSENNNLNMTEDKNSEYISFITNREIKIGEELLINYNNYN